MNFMKRFVSGLGAQAAPFGFGLDNPDTQYRAGLSFIGDVGANMLANNQGGRDPWTNLGMSMQEAKAGSLVRNRQAMAAQQMMQEAEDNRRKREEEAAALQKRNQWLQSISDPNQRAMLEAYPELAGDYIKATNPLFQTPEKPQVYEVGDALVDEGGNIIYQSPRNETSNVGVQIEERRAAAESMGLTPDDPAYKAYVLTGKMPREDQAPLTATDKKAILEADDAVMTNQAVVDQLQSVLAPDATGTTLNDRAGYGFTAGAQAWAARNDPTGVFDDAQGEATTELQNSVLGQALTSLKSIFGSAPTEGERKILVDLQASIDKTPKEREKIIRRAIDLANARLAFNKARAEGLRGESYYRPGGSPQAVTTEDGYTIEQVGE